MQRSVERFPVGPARGSRRSRRSKAAISVDQSRRKIGSRDAAASNPPPRSNQPRKPNQVLPQPNQLAKLTSKQRITSQVYNLELDVTALKQQIQELTLHRSLLSTKILSTQRDVDGWAVQKAIGYFSAFRRGLRSSDPTPAAYVASVFDEDLSLGVTGVGGGRDVLVEQWRRYTAYFAIRSYHIPSVRVLSSDDRTGACVVRGEGVFHGAFTRDALEIAFPSVLHDAQLTQELLGRELVTPVAFTLHFDTNGRVVRHDGEVDWFVALSETLGSRLRAAEIMERVYVAEEGILDAPSPPPGEPARRLPVAPPVTQVARAKRSRFAVVNDDDEEEEHGDNSSRRYFDCGDGLSGREPDLKPTGTAGVYSVSF